MSSPVPVNEHVRTLQEKSCLRRCVTNGREQDQHVGCYISPTPETHALLVLLGIGRPVVVFTPGDALTVHVTTSRRSQVVLSFPRCTKTQFTRSISRLLFEVDMNSRAHLVGDEIVRRTSPQGTCLHRDYQSIIYICVTFEGYIKENDHAVLY